MTNVAIVTTTINSEPEAYEAWAQQGDLIVAGDVSTPHTMEGWIKDIGGTYLTVEDQEHWAFADDLPWRCIQRRNTAVMEAYRQGYDFVVTVDDDNHPEPDFVDVHCGIVGGDITPSAWEVGTAGGWVNLGDYCEPETWQRGTPYGVEFDRNARTIWRGDYPIGVSQGLVLGSPDCDAITRMVDDPHITSIKENVVVTKGAWAAFNSQATVWEGAFAPLICVLPYVGRYDDIFASFIAQLILNDNNRLIYAGSPTVTQIRNEHNLVTDLRGEVMGLRKTLPLVARLEKLRGHDRDPATAYLNITRHLTGFLPDATIRFMARWAQTWQHYARSDS